MRGRHGITRTATAALLALMLAACQESVRATAPAASITPAPAHPSPTLASSAGSPAPIMVSGTPVIISSAIEFTPTPVDVPTPSPSGISTAGPDQPGEPQIVDFEVTPQTRLGFGDTVTVRWEVRAQTATLRYDYATASGAPAFGERITLKELKGSQQVRLKAVDALPMYVTFTLEARSGELDPLTGQPRAVISQIPAPIHCPYAWFFANPPQWCPSTDGAARGSVLQRFEQARMVATGDGGAGSTSSVTVLFTEQNFWITLPSVAAAQPEGGPAIDPALYGLWRDGTFFNRPLRDSIGAPSEAAVHYMAHRQCEVAPNSAITPRCFIDLPDGTVILLFLDADIGRAGTGWSVWKGE